MRQDHALNHLDPGIQQAVMALRAAGLKTFESCEGGPGHAFHEPTVRFNGDLQEGLKAVTAALEAGLKVWQLRRVWRMNAGELEGPWWDLVLVPTTGPFDVTGPSS
jgi:hypothetical protein